MKLRLNVTICREGNEAEETDSTGDEEGDEGKPV